jgi:hypothetical protein
MVGLCTSLVVLTALLWGALRAPRAAAGVQAFARLPDHDYLADIEALRQQEKLSEALALSQFVCAQPDYPQQQQACIVADELQAHMRTFWYRTRRVGWGALTGKATDGWALAGAATADFFVVGDLRDLMVQSWRAAHGQEVDELLTLLSAIGIGTVVLPSLDWVPSFSKTAVRLQALSTRFTATLTRLGRRAVATRTLVPLQDVWGNMRRLVLHLGAAKTLDILPLVDDTEELATVARLAVKQPEHAYSMLKTGGRQVLKMAASDATLSPDLVRAARKGASGIALLQRFGPRLFTSHLLVGASKALHRGRLSQAMSLWLATQTATTRVVVTVLLGGAWLLNLCVLWRLLGRLLWFPSRA